MPVPGLKHPCFRKVCVYYIYSQLHLFPASLQPFFYKVVDFQTPGLFLCYWSCCPSPGFIFFRHDLCNTLDHQNPCVNQNLPQSELLKVTIWTDYPHADSCYGDPVLLQNKIHISYHALKGLYPKLLLFAWSHLQLYSPYTVSLIYWSVSSI